MPDSRFYDLQSLAFSAVTVSVVTLLCLGPAAWAFPREYQTALRSWILGTAAMVLSDVLFVTSQSQAWSAVLLTILVATGVAEWRHAIRKFGGIEGRERWPYVVIGAGTLISILGGGEYVISSLVSSTCLAVLYLAAAAAASRLTIPARGATRRLLVTVLVVVAAVMIVRLGLFLAGVRSGAPPGTTTLPRALLFILASIGPIAGSLSFILMSSDRLADELRHLAAIDPLTGLRNRRTLLEALGHDLAVARRRNETVGLLSIDVDHFKQINDTYGHPAGDRALIAVARAISSVSRLEDSVGRLGGEEFAVVLPGADLEAARAAAERMRIAVASLQPDPSGTPRALTVSIGVAVIPATGAASEVASLLTRADAAMYEAKRQGRDRVAVDDPSPAR